MPAEKLPLQNQAKYLVCFIICTVPLLFGAVHPIVQGSYTFLVLIGLAGWLLLCGKEDSLASGEWWWVAAPVLVLFYIVLQSVPLPLELISYLSPARAARIEMINHLAGGSISFISLGERGILGLQTAAFLFALLIYYLAVRRLTARDQGAIMVIFYCLIGVGLVEALYGLIQFINPQVGLLWLKMKSRAATGTIIYKNQYASLLNLIWPLAAAGAAVIYMKAARSENSQVKVVSLASKLNDILSIRLQAPLLLMATIIIILAVLFSLSRGGILAMLLVLILLAYSFPFSFKAKAAFFTVLICLVGGYGTLLGWEMIVTRFTNIEGSANIRWSLYIGSIDMLRDHWLTGAGINAYSYLSPAYLKGFPTSVFFDKAHNEYLELAIELGLPVAILLLTWLLAGLASLIKEIAEIGAEAESTSSWILLAQAAAFGIVGFLAHGLVDFGWHLPANLFYAVTLLALAKSCLDAAQSENLRRRERES